MPITHCFNNNWESGVTVSYSRIPLLLTGNFVKSFLKNAPLNSRTIEWLKNIQNEASDGRNAAKLHVNDAGLQDDA
jgi:hypothetical protein